MSALVASSPSVLSNIHTPSINASYYSIFGIIIINFTVNYLPDTTLMHKISLVT
jgi:hypothetical protein